MVVLERTVLPPAGSDAQIARLAAAIAPGQEPAIIGPVGDRIELPQEIVDVLRQTLAAMTSGQAVTVAPHHTVLTTQQAAELLGVSRPTLVRLLVAGDIPYSQPGRHRRIDLTDLIAYQQSVSKVRRDTLHDMTAEAGEDDNYAAVNGFIPTR